LRHPGAQLHPGDVVAAGRAQRAQVRLAREPGVHNVDRAAEPPAEQVTLDLLDDRLVVGVSRPHPDAHWDPLAGDRKSDHDLGQIGAVVLGMTQAPQRPLLLDRCPGLRVLIARLVAL
jgi:hypothetical protein